MVELHTYVKSIEVTPELIKSLVTDKIDDAYIGRLNKFGIVLKNLNNPDMPLSKAIREQSQIMMKEFRL